MVFLYLKLRRRKERRAEMIKVKVIKRYSDVKTGKIEEVGNVLEVTEERARHLVSEGVAKELKESRGTKKETE